jgi:catechol 2,3-dioxygenase-like lactoylglutathione lyase family enzyme
MPEQLRVGAVHHLRLTVTDLQRSKDFYTKILGFQVAVDAPPPADHPDHALVKEALHNGVVLINGTLLMGLRPAAKQGDRFDENRVGLDHISFHVGSREVLERYKKALDEWNVPHGEITDLGSIFQIYLLEFRDPDGIQLELTAPYA